MFHESKKAEKNKNFHFSIIANKRLTSAVDTRNELIRHQVERHARGFNELSRDFSLSIANT